MAKETLQYPYPIDVYTDQIELIEGFNARETLDNKDLQASIKEQGIRIPLLVRETGRSFKDESNGHDYPLYELFDGHRRFGAVTKLQEKDPENTYLVPLRVYPESTTEAEMRLIMFHTGTESRTLSPLAQATIMATMRDKDGLSNVEIAQKTGKSKVLVGDYLLLIDTASPTIIKQIKSGTLSATQAITLLKSEGAEGAEELVNKTAENLEGETNKKITAKKIDTATGKKSTIAGLTKADAATDTTPPKGKHAASITLLEDLHTSYAVQGEDKTNTGNLDLLTNIIGYLKGELEPYELAPFFLNEDAFTPATKKADAEPVEETKAAPKKKSLKEQLAEVDAEAEQGKKAAKKTAKTKVADAKEEAPVEKKPKAKSAPVTDDDFDFPGDEEE